MKRLFRFFNHAPTELPCSARHQLAYALEHRDLVDWYLRGVASVVDVAGSSCGAVRLGSAQSDAEDLERDYLAGAADWHAAREHFDSERRAAE
jgi:hypothetical protein